MSGFPDWTGRGSPLRPSAHGRALLIVGMAVALLLGAVAAPPVHTAVDRAGKRGARTTPAEERRRARDDAATGRAGALFPLLGNAEAWARLPPVRHGGGQPLPRWARALAAFLPHTTAAMLELDYLHRARSPLPPVLRAEVRWVAAHAHGCRYSEACAAADLRDAGADEDRIRALAGDLDGFPEAERAALLLARKLTLAGDTVTDDEMARLMSDYGEKQVVALVLLLAHASFQDRLLLTLDVPPEDEALKPLDVRFVQRPLWAIVSRRPAPEPPRDPPPAPAEPAAERPGPGPDVRGLRQALEQQRCRPPRIALPGDEPGQVRWGLVCRVYQPELAAAWSACAHAFAAEADQDPIFEQSVFWVVTRTLNCFY